MTILIVDDSESQRFLLTSILAGAGYPDVVNVASAREALALLRTASPPNDSKRGQAAPDIELILMDLAMPEMNGVEACRQINTPDNVLDIPVIMVTASTEMEDLQAAFEAGALDYITKPVNGVELRARLRSALRLKQEMERRKEREQALLETTRQLAEANAQLERLSASDGLTGLANRRHFDIRLEREWKRALRVETSLALILLDVDFFKRYNDTYGHQSGDDCLKRVASVLAGAAQRSDDLAARYGGEEFALILPNTNLPGALHVAEQLRTSVEALRLPHSASQASAWVTLSLGVAAMIPTLDSTPAELFTLADQALYRAKQEGRNRVQAPTPGWQPTS